VKRFIDFHNFCESKKAMLNAASAYSAPVRRFMYDSRNQGAHYSINAACEGVKIVGAALQCSPAVIGGIVAAQVASGVEAVEAVLYELAKRYQLEHAWTTYKRALRDPENRKLGLIAMRENPTLAKYAVAWGAVIQKDPLVTDFIGYCGIDSETIRGNTNVPRVVEYLEARMPDDVVVVGRDVGSDADWAPASVSLTADSWIDAKTRGETMGGVTPIDTPAIESAFLNFEKAAASLEKAKTRSLKTREAKAGACLARLKELVPALRNYKPKDKNSKEHHEEMWQVTLQFVAKADLELAEMKKKGDDIRAEIKAEKDAAKQKAKAEKGKLETAKVK
jgi:hypothetical protein